MPIGSLIGDFVGARFERHNTHLTAFDWISPQSRFTDDTVLTLATCRALLDDLPYPKAYRDAVQRFPGVGYGKNFQQWALGPPTLGTPRSPGNGAAMRVSPIAWAKTSLTDVLAAATSSARSTHDHPGAIAGACAVAAGVFILRTGGALADACAQAEALGMLQPLTIEAWRKRPWSALAKHTVPVAFAALQAGHDFESTVRLAISAGGDSDTIASMAAALAQARWNLPRPLAAPILGQLQRAAPSLHQRLQSFCVRFHVPPPHPESPHV